VPDAALHGLLAVDKPQGWTSHDVVARVRRLVGQRSVGHGGTLDPLATGVLPLGLGQGTRVLEYLTGGRKRYAATLLLGAETDTYDAEGAVTATATWQHVAREALDSALVAFRGPILQRPPAFSAIKRGGQAAYTLARRGQAVELAPRAVTIEDLTVTRFAPPEIDLDVLCSAGTYIRSLAYDLGRALGSAAHLVALRRSAAGGLTLADALPLAAFEAGGRTLIEERLLAPDRALLDRPALILGEPEARGLENGVRPIVPPTTNGIVRVYDAAGGFLATLRAEDGHWHDAKVFALA
jgi:tRNA pseudouridine55 synthase